MRCPNCESRSIGRVGSAQYYCWDCCVEFTVAHGGVRVYHLDLDGELIAAASTEIPAGPVEPTPVLRRP